MSSHYESVQLAALYPDAFKVAAPDMLPGRHVTPRKAGVFIRKGPAGEVMAAEAGATGTLASSETSGPTEHVETAAGPVRELATGQFGLVPPWVKSASDAKLRSTKLVNARSETVTTSNNFREAWLGARRCIVPVMAFFEDDFRSGKAVPTRIARVDGKPMGLAGLWESWTGAEGDTIISFTLLTINANAHALMSRYQQPGNEKRMPVILNEGAFDAWLGAHPEKAREFLRAYPANWLLANPVQK
jgi:putative SOS response-associated peptidase YedK